MRAIINILTSLGLFRPTRKTTNPSPRPASIPSGSVSARLAVQTRFAPVVTFPVAVVTASPAVLPACRLRIIKASAPSWGNVPAGGHPSTDRNAPTTKGSQFN